MSDEEKGELEKIAMLELNRFIYGKHLSEGDIKDNLSILFEIIKKQSKEIEELKENNGYHLGFIDGGIAKRYEYEDKIKAKVEDILNSENEEAIEKLIELQSLLEKRSR